MRLDAGGVSRRQLTITRLPSRTESAARQADMALHREWPRAFLMAHVLFASMVRVCAADRATPLHRLQHCYRKPRASLRMPSRISPSRNEAKPRSSPLGSGTDRAYRSNARVSTPTADAALSASPELIEFFRCAAV